MDTLSATATLLLLALFLVLIFSLVASILSSAFPEEIKPAPLVIAPDWRLFGPRPISTDRYLVARHRPRESSRFTAWETLWSQPEPSAIRFLWNPGRRVTTAIFQLESQLSKAAKSNRPVTESAAYLALQDVAVAAMADGRDTGDVQFAILASNYSAGERVYRVVMRSEIIALES
ncbi:hypothetical protein ABZ619_18350 [Streptomyces sp. NPDC007851]|uniref:hypothetical protein n=1 Tax=Streptomyces sp. NPDC007851 TaxID=3155008 RepID=UPI0033D2B5B7